jgi:hypothetical protein
LIGAVVRIPFLNIGAATDENGEFKIPSVPVGRYDILISYLGYEEEKSEFIVMMPIIYS